MLAVVPAYHEETSAVVAHATRHVMSMNVATAQSTRDCQNSGDEWVLKYRSTSCLDVYSSNQLK
jgi:hypothetical protein